MQTDNMAAREVLSSVVHLMEIVIVALEMSCGILFGERERATEYKLHTEGRNY
jgi:hypothetical protein